MTKLDITPSELVVHVQGWDRFWAFKSELRVPLTHVVGVERATDEARKLWHGIRAPGTHFPGIIIAGTYLEQDGRVFWDVRDATRAIEIRLHDDHFARLVIEVEDPDAAVAALAEMISARVGA
jgi:hypothetical protein